MVQNITHLIKIHRQFPDELTSTLDDILVVTESHLANEPITK